MIWLEDPALGGKVANRFMVVTLLPDTAWLQNTSSQHSQEKGHHDDGRWVTIEELVLWVH